MILNKRKCVTDGSVWYDIGYNRYGYCKKYRNYIKSFENQVLYYDKNYFNSQNFTILIQYESTRIEFNEIIFFQSMEELDDETEEDWY